MPFMFACDPDFMTSTKLRVDDEAERDMASTVLELSDRYPDVATETIHTLAHQAYSRMTPAKVQSYLPILVGREVRETLDARRAA
jgi:hypothetical protein